MNNEQNKIDCDVFNQPVINKMLLNNFTEDEILKQIKKNKNKKNTRS